MLKKTLTILMDVLLGMLVFLAAVSVASSVQMKITKDHIPGIGPYRYMTVLSGSMSPVFNPYDVAVDKKMNVDELQKGDVITFSKDSSLVTHRIVEVTRNQGKISFRTKGDANNVEDSELVDGSQVIGKYIFRIPLLGHVMAKLRGVAGVVLLWASSICMFVQELVSVMRRKKLDEAGDDKGEDELDMGMQVDEISGFITVYELNACCREEVRDGCDEQEEESHIYIRYPDEK